MAPQETHADASEPRQEAASRCRPADHSLSETALADDVQTLATLGNETRYEALRIIAEADDGVCVCQLEPTLGVTQGAVSQALSRLFAAGLVTRRIEGRWRYYSATDRAERILETLDHARDATDD